MFRYDYLWAREEASGNRRGLKQRPSCVILALGAGQAVYLAISHEPPREGQVAVEIPPEVRTIAGLDGARQWVVVSEFNFDRHGPRLVAIPGKRGQKRYGTLPPSFFEEVKSAFLAQRKAGTQKKVDRTKDAA